MRFTCLFFAGGTSLEDAGTIWILCNYSDIGHFGLCFDVPFQDGPELVRGKVVGSQCSTCSSGLTTCGGTIKT